MKIYKNVYDYCCNPVCDLFCFAIFCSKCFVLLIINLWLYISEEALMVSSATQAESSVIFRTNSYVLFLKKEMRIWNPQIVFFFGKRAKEMGYYLELSKLLPDATFQRLHHPAARMSRARIIEENDEWIRSAFCKQTKNEKEATS